MTFPILTSLIALPLAGAILLLFVRDDEHNEVLIRSIALVVSVLVFAETLLLWSRFNPASADFQFIERHAWIPDFGISYFVGVDGISLLLLVLTGFLTPLALLGSWESIHRNTRAFCMVVPTGPVPATIRSPAFSMVTVSLMERPIWGLFLASFSKKSQP